MKTLTKLIAIVAVGATVLSGCTIVNTAEQADAGAVLNPEAAPTNSSELFGVDNGGEGSELLETGVAFVNTGSVLFPVHQISQEALAAQMESYLDSFEDFLPKELYVSRTEYVRSGPGTFYSPIRIAKSWETVMVDGRSGSWYRMADRTGYFPAHRLIDLFNPTGLAWELKVVNSGDEEAIDACLGGLTDYLPMRDDLGVPVWSMHGNCGGETAYDLQVNDVILVDGAKYQVVSHALLPLFSSTEALRGMHDQDAFLQVCDLVQGVSHIIGLKGMS